jgi:hypothetical protein
MEPVWGMGLLGLLGLVIAILIIAALVKYILPLINGVRR